MNDYRSGPDTPRTDAALMNRLNMTERDFFWWVQADFARTLEGELNETRQLLAEKNETANVFMRQVKELQSQVAELINQRNQLLDKNSALKMLCADNGITVKSITVAEPSNDKLTYPASVSSSREGGTDGNNRG